MPKFLIDRESEDIRRELTDILRSLKDPRITGMLTIVRVDVSSDGSYCKVYVSVYGELNEKEFKRGLKSASPWLRRELGSSLNLRYTPELIFELDKSIEHGAYINSLIEKLDISGEAADGEN